MNNKLIRLLSAGAIVMCTAMPAFADCTNGILVNVRGKIVNNLQAGGAFSTLGVVHLIMDNIGKMKCGIVGESAAPQVPANQGGVGFVHTISCDDNVMLNVPGSGQMIAHSQLTLDTQGVIAPQFCNGVDTSNGIFGTFSETSVPKTVMGNSTGRGVFTSVTEGQINIQGSVNCAGSVDMHFRGYVCLQPQP